MKCPICKRSVSFSDPEFPFCSERCRLIDLGNWADGRYKVAVALPDTEGVSSPAGEEEPSPAPSPATTATVSGPTRTRNGASEVKGK